MDAGNDKRKAGILAESARPHRFALRPMVRASGLRRAKTGLIG
ncbi:hypothetical protein [Xanthomonas oryzae]|nr:hypothetical protein [Xanthomonas oryzae]